MVGRTLRISCGSFSRLSKNVTGMPQRIGQQFDHHALRDVRRRQKGDSRILRPERQHRWPHVDIRDQGLVRHQRHLRLAGGAAGEVQNGRIGWRISAANPRRQARIPRHRFPSSRAQFVQSQSPVGFTGEQYPVADGRAPQGLQSSRVFDECRACPGRFYGAHQVGRRIAGIHGGGDGAVGHDSQVGQVELQARLRIQRHHVAFGDAEGVQPASDLLHRAPVLIPGIRQVSVTGGLMQRRRIAVNLCRLFQDLVYSTRGHNLQFNMRASSGRLTRSRRDTATAG